MIRKKIAVMAVCVMFAAALLTGCGGGEKVTTTENNMNTQTLGQQLIDLDNAYKQGAISEDEYEDLKEALLEKY